MVSLMILKNLVILVNMKNCEILQGDSHDFHETYSGEYNNSGDSDVL